MQSRKLLAAAIAAAFFAPAFAADNEPKTLETVTVTGSLIPRAVVETATPTIEITAADIQKQGFKTVADALRASPLASGAVQNAQSSSSFTQGAQSISLFGLDPGFTKILVDGHPLANYPLLYNGQSNFVDISTIPTSIVERIDIVPGNQSAVYGSDAIAGVVNIILKKNVDGFDVNFRGGGYTDGGGGNQRVQLTGGHSTDRSKTVFSVELGNQAPIYGADRKLTRSTASDPSRNGADPIASRNFLRLAYDANGRGSYVDPGAGACENVSSLFNNSTYYAYRPGSGYYCGSQDVGQATLMNKKRSATGYVSSSFKVNDHLELYGSGLYGSSTNTSIAGSNYTFWSANNGGRFIDQATGQQTIAQHALSPEETGGYDRIGNRNIGQQYQVIAGARGKLGDSAWDYDAYYNRSAYSLTNKQNRPLAGPIDALFEKQFMGPKLGNDAATGLPIYAPNWANFYQAVTPEQYIATLGQINSVSQTWTQDLNVQLTNTSLASLPAGDIGLAIVGQAGNEHWSNRTDLAVVNRDYWGLSGTQGHGKRQHYALAGELSVPITAELLASAAVRYDRYQWTGNAIGRPTYKLAFEYRPIDTLLLRANYATAFRAPDMGYLFAGDSGYFIGAPDFYGCETFYPGEALRDCPAYNQSTRGVRAGNPDLKPITAKSYGVGAVWSPTQDFNLSLDYLSIRIADKVEDLSITTLFRNEAGCRTGRQDAGSATCQDALSRISRDATGAVTNIRSGPINSSNERVDALTVGANYRIDMGNAGNLRLGASYSNTLKHTLQQYAGEATIDLLRAPQYSTDFKTITTASVGWDRGDWSATLFGNRRGRTPNYLAQVNNSYAVPGAGRLGSWTTFNMNIGYQLPDDASLSLVLNNLRNTKPPMDQSYYALPYFNVGNYDVYGRSVFVEFNWHFGGKK